MYTDSDKFDGEGSNSLNFKLNIFHITCYNARLLKGELLRAFLIMLKGLARDYFYTYCHERQLQGWKGRQSRRVSITTIQS